MSTSKIIGLTIMCILLIIDSILGIIILVGDIRETVKDTLKESKDINTISEGSFNVKDFQKLIFRIEADTLVVCAPVLNDTSLEDFISSYKGYYFQAFPSDFYDDNKIFTIGYYSCEHQNLFWMKYTLDDFREKYFNKHLTTK